MSPELFDFDYWKSLAEQDPRGFFLARQCLIEEFIASAPADVRDGLLQFQNTIDCARAEAVSPMKAVRMIVSMIGDHLDALQSQMSKLRDESEVVRDTLNRLKD